MSRTTRNGRAQRHRFYGEFRPVGAPHNNYRLVRADVDSDVTHSMREMRLACKRSIS